MAEENLDGKKKESRVIQEAIKIRDSGAQDLSTYGCHTVSSYGDGYGDAGYGDYGDAD